MPGTHVEVSVSCPRSRCPPLSDDVMLPSVAPDHLDDHHDGGEEKHGKPLIGRMLSLLKGIKHGGDISKLLVPPSFNMPKSQLQLYGEAVYNCKPDLLDMCNDADSPIERFLAVVQWHISTTRPCPFGKAPFNPVLGETHYVSRGDLHVLIEQVSHHPPISALYATNEKKRIKMEWWQQPSPRFYGSWLEATVAGHRVVHLEGHGESYVLTSPRLSMRFLPVPGTEWVGNTSVRCEESGLEASVCFRAKTFFGMGGGNNKVTGHVRDTRTHKTLYDIEGHWHETVSIRDKTTQQSRLLYNGREVLSTLVSPVVHNREQMLPTEALLVWADVSRAINEQDWRMAGEAKKKVEEEQRAARRREAAAQEVWVPHFFKKSQDEVGWVWRAEDKWLKPAPIHVPI